VANGAQQPPSETTRNTRAETSQPRLHVVGIGASAGGLGALRTLFSAIPESAPGVAFVVVVHLDPANESRFDQLLQPYTRMRVEQVTQTTRLEPNRVYVIPPNANLNTIDTHLRLSPLEERRIERAPIDHFLRTLAHAHDGGAIGVILTGAGTDGALGIRQIKERGGLTIVQDPHEAEFDAMPLAAIETGLVDLVVPVRAMANEILSFCDTQPRLPPFNGEEPIADGDAVALDSIVRELEARTGRPFGVYARAVVLSRIERRMRLCRVDSLADYAGLIRARSDEARSLADDLLLGVTEFFRDADVFEGLERLVLPRLFDDASNHRDQVRVWSIGCSSGEEAYSLAILLLEASLRSGSRRRLQVFASDLTDAMRARARNGVYPFTVAASLSPDRLQRFFTQHGSTVSVNAEVRDIVLFASHNVFKDPPYSHLDVIVCRNLLRELQPDVRRGLLRLFHFALEPDGALIVDGADDVDAALFEADAATPGLYRKRSHSAAIVHSFARSASPFRAEHVARRFRAEHVARVVDIPYPIRSEVSALHGERMQRYAPPSVLIGNADEIVHYSSTASRYLRIPGGELTHNVFEMLAEPLRSTLREGLQHVRSKGGRWSSKTVLALDDHGKRRRVVLHVEAVDGVQVEPLWMIVFDDAAIATGTPDIDPAERIDKLRKELDRTQRRLSEILDTSERIDDTNVADRMQFSEIRGEIALAQQALQGAHRELNAVDELNRAQIVELAQSSLDLKYLLESTGIATLFLDTELQVVRYTPQLASLITIPEHEPARALAELRHVLDYDDLEKDARRALEHLTLIEREVSNRHDPRWFLVRMLPYRGAVHSVDGVVITLIDITGRKHAEEELRTANRRKDEFLALLAHELRNPLAPISSGIDVLKMASNDPQIVEQIAATMARQTRQLVHLVDDLLEISRISGGRLRLRIAEVRLADVVRDAVNAVRPIVDRARHELIVRVPSEPIVLDADALRLTQVLVNLLNNAARYTPEGGRIELGIEREGGSAKIVVRDNGIGMPPEVLRHAFDMFYQGDDSRLPRTAGLGIGLTLAKTLVDMHGGSMDVSSEGPDRGSEFTVRLPIPRVHAPPLPPKAAPANDRLGGHRVLIVDDNGDAAQTLGVLVTALGKNDVRVASSGADALKIAEDQHPDIVLLDLKMPDMDGFEVARRLRRRPWAAHTLLVALTGWGMDEHKRRTKEVGFDRHLTKPADRTMLESVLSDESRAHR
jgi:two-component system CheB/CheR fusion protein